jgi:cytochrome P450 family 110
MPGPVPPGPARLSLYDTVEATISSPYPLIHRMRERYGDTVRVPGQFGFVTYAGDPKAIEAVYTMDPDSFEMSGRRFGEPIFGAAGVALTSGARHKKDRKLLMPAFNASVMRGYAGVIAKITEEAASRMPPGTKTSMLRVCQDIALDVIVRVVFGVTDEQRLGIVREAVLEMIDALHPVIVGFPWTRKQLGGIGPYARWTRRVERLHALMREEIASRRGDTERKDILSLMMRCRYDDGSAMSEDDLLDQLRTLLFAGHETTAISMTWAMHFLHRDPESLARVLAEVDGLGADPAPEDFLGLPFLEAVIHETLRMRPPVVDVGRLLLKDLDLPRYTIPAGESITPSPAILHLREDIFPDAEAFIPTRFVGKKYSPFEYIPFGGGARRCLGAGFAMIEMKVVLGMMLARHRFRDAEAGSVASVRRGLTIGPKTGLAMVRLAKRRRG